MQSLICKPHPNIGYIFDDSTEMRTPRRPQDTYQIIQLSAPVGNGRRSRSLPPSLPFRHDQVVQLQTKLQTASRTITNDLPTHRCIQVTSSKTRQDLVTSSGLHPALQRSTFSPPKRPYMHHHHFSLARYLSVTPFCVFFGRVRVIVRESTRCYAVV